MIIENCEYDMNNQLLDNIFNNENKTQVEEQHPIPKKRGRKPKNYITSNINNNILNDQELKISNITNNFNENNNENDHNNEKKIKNKKIKKETSILDINQELKIEKKSKKIKNKKIIYNQDLLNYSNQIFCLNDQNMNIEQESSNLHTITSSGTISIHGTRSQMNGIMSSTLGSLTNIQNNQENSDDENDNNSNLKYNKKRGRKPKEKIYGFREETNQMESLELDVNLILHLPIYLKEIQEQFALDHDILEYKPEISEPIPYDTNEYSSYEYIKHNETNIMQNTINGNSYSMLENEHDRGFNIDRDKNSNCNLEYENEREYDQNRDHWKSTTTLFSSSSTNTKNINIIQSFNNIQTNIPSNKLYNLSNFLKVNENSTNDFENNDRVLFNNMQSSGSSIIPDIKDKDQFTNSSNIIFNSDKSKKKIIQIMFEFIDKNNYTKNEWPISTNIYCMWCCHPFDTIPCAIPNSYINEKFYVSGCFCSFGCTAAHIFDEKSSIMWEKYSLLNLMYKKMYNTNFVKIQLAPPRRLLKIFGGILSIDEFRNNLLKIYKVIEPPLIPILPKVEENIVDFSTTNNRYNKKTNKIQQIIQNTQHIQNLKDKYQAELTEFSVKGKTLINYLDPDN